MKLKDNQERKDNYSNMMNSNGWKDLETWAESEIQRSIAHMDSVPAKEMTVTQFAEERGFRKGIRKFLDQAYSVREKGF